jgi:hypothetical protein
MSLERAHIDLHYCGYGRPEGDDVLNVRVLHVEHATCINIGPVTIYLAPCQLAKFKADVAALEEHPDIKRELESTADVPMSLREVDEMAAARMAPLPAETIAKATGPIEVVKVTDDDDVPF